jgi:trans-2,3-dihydro-3-hydroxyanthranilate isomerase
VGDHRYTLLDVFTSRPLEGNGLAVVHDAGDVSPETMLAFAREMRLSETTFVQPSHIAGADYRNRIWTIEGELPFAGHPSLGTAVAVARAQSVQGAVRYVQETEAGLQPIDVQIDGERASASMLQEPPVYGPELARAPTLEAIGLTRDHADPHLPPQIVSTGVPHLIAPLRDGDALARARPDWGAIAALQAPHSALALYAVVCDPATGRVSARSFVSAAVGEDPATGSAAGPLCAYLAQRTGCSAIVIDQGLEIGRPSRLRATIEGDRPRVSGDVVLVVDGTVHL